MCSRPVSNLSTREPSVAILLPNASKSMATAANDTGATEPGATAAMERGLPLRELNKRSARHGNWILKAVKADIISYTYPWKGKEATNNKLKVIFTAPEEGSYCMGLMKMNKKNIEELETARDNKFKKGALFRATKVAFLEEKQQYVHTPFKLVLDLRVTQFAGLLTVSFPMPSLPSPPADVAAIVTIKTEGAHRFDITGFCSMSDVRTHATPRGFRAIADIEVMDGSTTESGKKAMLAFTLFVQCAGLGAMPAAMTEFKKLVDHQSPISLFSLTAVPKGGKVEIKTPDEFYWAEGIGAKAERLRNQSTELQSLSAGEKEKVTAEDTWVPTQARDYLEERGQLATVALIDAYGGDNATIAHDKVFQLNFVEVEPPAGGTPVLTLAGDRIWIRAVTVNDFTGSIQLGMREKAALQLAGLDPSDPDSKQRFATMANEGDVQFPMLASVLVHLKKDDAKLQNSQETFGNQESPEVRLTIVEAQEQDISQLPNASLLELLAYVKECAPRMDAMLPATLAQVKTSAYYPLEVVVGASARPCQKALVLVVSTERTEQTNIGNDACRMVTKRVFDGVTQDEGSRFDLVALCNSHKTRDAILDPPRTGSKKQYALALITAAPEETSFVLQMVQLLTPEEVKHATAMMKCLLYVVTQTRFDGIMKRPLWTTEGPNPIAMIKKCRSLGAHPTDKSIPEEGV